MCALATFERRQIKVALLESENFSYYLEQEPYMRDIIDAYMASKFRVVLQLLDRYSARHLLDLQLNHHVKALTKLIKDKALVLYFGPFASIRLDSLAEAFGLTPEETEKNVVTLIQDGSIKGRVDSHNKVSLAISSYYPSNSVSRFSKPRIWTTAQNCTYGPQRLAKRLPLRIANYCTGYDCE